MTYFCHWIARAIFLSLWTSFRINQSDRRVRKTLLFHLVRFFFSTKMLLFRNVIFKDSLKKFYSFSKRYNSSESSDVFKVQERGLFIDNLAEIE